MKIWWLFSFIFGLINQLNGLTGRGVVYPGRNDLFELSILHINDFHARFEEVGPRAETCHREKGEQCIGGLARVRSAVTEMLIQRPNSIFLNAGDHFQGTLWYNVHRWNATAFFLNMIPHDAMTIGNHEFDDRIEGLVPFLKAVKAPVVVSNIDMTNEPTLENLTRSSVILNRGGHKIGVIGVILKTTPVISNTGRLIFLDEVESVNAEAKKLKANGTDIIIVLSHCGLEIDRKMALQCPLIDVIVGGHSHTFLYNGDQLPFIDSPEDDYPVVINQNEANRTVLIVQALAFTKYLGNLTVWFDSKGEIEDWEGNPILLDDSFQQDPEVLEALKPWKSAVDEIGLKIVGQARVDLMGGCKKGECNLGNLVTDAMIESYINEVSEQDHWTVASVAVMNGGSIRSSIISPMVSKNITYGDLIMVQPFENTWDIIEIQGKHIRQTLEYCVSLSSKEKWNGYPFVVWSGLKVSYNMSKEPFSRVEQVKVNCRKCLVPTYKDLNDDSWYKLIAPSFLINGGDGHSIIADNHRNRTIGFKDIDYLVKFVEKMSPLIYGTEGRINFV